MNQRWREGSASWRPPEERIRTADYEVAPLDETPAKAFVTAHHYSGTYPAARFRFGLFRGAQLAGAAVFSVPVNARAFRPLPGPADTSVELGRFVLLDDVAGNGETWFLGRAFELLRREGLSGVLSFSDPVPRRSHSGQLVFPGHAGTIYQAHNAVYLGLGTARTLRLLPDGRALSPRALQKVRRRERGWRYAAAQLEALGAAPLWQGDDACAWVREWVACLTRPLRHGGCHKYVWGLDRATRRALPPSQRYPKLGAYGPLFSLCGESPLRAG